MKIKYEAEVKDCNECKLYRNCICSHDGMLASFKATRVGDIEEYGIDKLPCDRRPCPAERKVPISTKKAVSIAMEAVNAEHQDAKIVDALFEGIEIGEDVCDVIISIPYKPITFDEGERTQRKYITVRMSSDKGNVMGIKEEVL